ncbi:sugar phosphate isomerase/epimerase family protein [Streptomyces albus subsp. chlorinus]|uniref:sugar phosphate isomerase/epimerase family protein n=1 Tax=Streptomyces albus TaxID=1888 RepID=UPI0031F689D6
MLGSRCAGIGDEAATDLEGQIAAVRALGWRRIELRTVDGVALGDLSPARTRDLASRLAGAGLGVVCLDSRIGNWARPVTAPFDADVAELETLLEQCALLDCRFVRVMSYPNDGLPRVEWAATVIDRLSRLARRAEQAGVTLLHENCAGWAGESPARMLRLLDEVGSPALRLLFDTGNGVPYGYDARAVLERTLPYVEHVHIKDAVEDVRPSGPTTGERVRYVLPGDGRAGVADCLRTLLDTGYRGAFSLEPHLAVQPHTGRRDDDHAARLFVAAGRRLGTLLAQAGEATLRTAGAS